MSQRLTDSRLANIGARTIQQAFETYHTQFEAITLQAKSRFKKEDWHRLQEACS